MHADPVVSVDHVHIILEARINNKGMFEQPGGLRR